PERRPVRLQLVPPSVLPLPSLGGTGPLLHAGFGARRRRLRVVDERFHLPEERCPTRGRVRGALAPVRTRSERDPAAPSPGPRRGRAGLLADAAADLGQRPRLLLGAAPRPVTRGGGIRVVERLVSFLSA